MTDYTLVVLVVFAPQSLKGSIVMTAKVQALDDWIRSDFKAMNTSLEHEYSRSSERQSTIGIGDNMIAAADGFGKRLRCINNAIASVKKLRGGIPIDFPDISAGELDVCAGCGVGASNGRGGGAGRGLARADDRVAVQGLGRR